MDQAYARKSKRYQTSEVFDHSSHPTLIKEIQAMRGGTFFVLEENSFKLKFYNQNFEVFHFIENKRFSKLETRGFITDFAYNSEDSIVGIISSDKKMSFWETIFSKRQIWCKELKMILLGIWYLKQAKIWVTASEDHFLTIWDVEKYRKTVLIEKRRFKAHLDLITDIAELTASKMMASSSLEGIIRIWDLETFTNVTELEDTIVGRAKGARKVNGVRKLSYTEVCGGNLLSVSYQNYINIWSPDSSLSKSYVGKLEGHSGIVKDCKIIPNSPHCISVDDKLNVRVWDLRTYLTIQMIKDEVGVGKLVVTTLAVIPKQDRFIIGGKRLKIYNNDTMRKNLKNFNDELFPMKAIFNPYYKTFCVMTK